MNDIQLLCYAYRAALHSPDPSTQNGALLCTAVGQPLLETLSCNEFPFGLAYEDERWERPFKYGWVEHAERNAIYKAAKLGVKTAGLKMVCPWAACADCARAIVQSGIEKLVRRSLGGTNGRWAASVEAGDVILREGGVLIEEVEIDQFGWFKKLKPIRRDGELWQPC